MWAYVRPLTQVNPKLWIQVLQVLKLQDLKSQQKVIQILTMHQLTNTYNVQAPQYPKLMWGQD